MLSSQAKSLILSKISSNIGYAIKEDELSPDLRRAILTLVSIQKSLALIEEISRGEKARVKSSVILSIASKIHPSTEDPKVKNQIEELHDKIENKISEISNRILSEEKRRKEENSNATINDKNTKAIELKCTKCGAPLQIPVSEYVKCSYCGTTIFIQDFMPQLSDIVTKI